MEKLKAMPILLKALCGLLLLWVVMTIAVSISMPDRDIAFYGVILTGVLGHIVVIIIDILCPIIFVYASVRKLHWGGIFGMAYNGVFIINGLISLFLFQEKFGNAIYFPLIASILFFSVIVKERKYFA